MRRPNSRRPCSILTHGRCPRTSGTSCCCRRLRCADRCCLQSKVNVTFGVVHSNENVYSLENNYINFILDLPEEIQFITVFSQPNYKIVKFGNFVNFLICLVGQYLPNLSKISLFLKKLPNLSKLASFLYFL